MIDYFAQEVENAPRDYFADEVINQSPTQPKSITNPIIAAVKSASEIIPGTLFATQYWKQGGPFNSQAIQEANKIVEPIEQAKVEGVPAQLAYGAVQAAPLVAGVANPFMSGAGKVLLASRGIPVAGRILSAPIVRSGLGFAGYEAAKNLAGGQIQNIPEAAKQGAISGALFHGGAKLGSTVIGKPLQQITKFGNRIGSAIGAGGVSAATSSPDQRVSSGILGAAFGAKYPTEPLGNKTPGKLVSEATGIYRSILRPTQGEVKKIEVIKGGDINKYYTLAAKERLPIERTQDKKLDTTKAREILSEKVSDLSDQLDTILKSNKYDRFDLQAIGTKAKIKSSKEIKNASEAETAKSQIQDYIDSEMRRYKTRYVSASQLNRIKQGMWSVGYDALRPTAQQNARRLGYFIRDTIEKAFPENSIRSLNRKSGDYQTLISLLENAQGRVVKGGRLGGYVSRTIGAVAGSKVPIIGPIAGAYLGGKVSDIMQNPEVATRTAGNKIRQAERLSNPRYPLDEAIVRQNKKLLGNKGELNLTPLHEEARKYKTPEEFVKSQNTVFHGTGTKFNKFDDTMRGTITGAKSAQGAIWFTDDLKTAQAYSTHAAETGVVKKALAEADALEKIAKKSGKQSDWNKYDAKLAEAEKLDTYEASFERRKDANVKEAILNGDFYEIDAQGKTPQELSSEGDIDSWLNKQIKKAKKLGKDGIKITNLDDAVGLYDHPATHYGIFKSNNIIEKSYLTRIWNEAHGK